MCIPEVNEWIRYPLNVEIACVPEVVVTVALLLEILGFPNVFQVLPSKISVRFVSVLNLIIPDVALFV